MKNFFAKVALIGSILFLSGCGGSQIFQNKEYQKREDKNKNENVGRNYNQREEGQGIYSGWKFYENKEYGISFKYPENFRIEETKTPKNVLETQIVDEWVGPIVFDAVMIRNEEVDDSSYDSGMGLSVSKIDKRENLFGNSITPEDLISKEDLTIGDRKAIKYTHKGSGVDENGNFIEEAYLGSIYQIDGGGCFYEFYSFGSDNEYFESLEQVVKTIEIK